MSEKKSVGDAFKWIFFLPVALIGGYAVKWAAFILVGLIIFRIVGQDSHYAQIFTNVVTNAIWGAATVYIAAWIVPAHKGTAAVASCGSVLLIAVLFSIADNLWPIYWLISVIIGASAVTYIICRHNPSIKKREKNLTEF